MQIWNPKRLEQPQPNHGQPGDSVQHRKSVATGSTAPSMAPSVGKSSATSHSSPIMTENATAFSFEMPGMPNLVFYLSADGRGEEMSFLAIESEFHWLEFTKPES